jgi:hypothetical protein
MTTGYGNVKFAYWNDTGSTDATRTIKLNHSATTVVAVYEVTQTQAMMRAGPLSSMIPAVLAPFELCLIPRFYASRSRLS